MSRGKHDTFKPTDETYRSGWDRVFNTNQTKELEDELAKKKKRIYIKAIRVISPAKTKPVR